MEVYKTEYKDYSNHAVIMVSTDRQILREGSAVRERMIEYSKLYKELHIIVFSRENIQPFNISPTCTVHSTGTFFRWNYVSSACKIGKNILRRIDKQMPILVSCENPFEAGLAGKCIAHMRKNSELLVQIHTDLFSPYYKNHSILNKICLYISNFTLPHAQVIRVVSGKIADSLVAKGFEKEKIIVKPISVNTDYIKNSIPAFSLKEKYPQFKKIVIMVSRLESEKNMTLALDAFKIVKDNRPEIGLIIIGDGREMKALKSKAKSLKIENNVVFVGWQTDLIPYYKGCDAFLCTSLYEGYGMVFKEAEAVGCKIISTDVGIAREIGATIVEWNASDIANKIYEI